MAYLNRIEAQDAQPITLPAIVANDDARPDFSPLEWSVIRLARIDPPRRGKIVGQRSPAR